MKSPLEKTPALPVAEMLSTLQCSIEIKHFLMKITDFANVNRITLKPFRIETDMSWALIQSCSIIFNGMDI